MHPSIPDQLSKQRAHTHIFALIATNSSARSVPRLYRKIDTTERT
jgi:hypothetical protein